MSFQGLGAVVKRLLITIVFFSVAFANSLGQGVRVATAANLQSVIGALKADFKKRSGIAIEPIVGSSGKLVAQINNGAPFDVFLSADMDFPQALYKKGLATKAPVAYAFGKLVICSRQNIGFANWERDLLAPVVKKIVIANPDVAPYGVAAKEALQTQGIFDDVQSKLVFGESIAQVNTYITTGVVDVGFTSQALINDPANKAKLYWQAIDPKLYTPIEQGMILLNRASKNAGALKFYNYLQSADAKRIFAKYGYK
ncbi:molybdate ABC transporter substrate-binding protein [Mucilaginibacter auburnensis]|uniref:Molybdate transport system substrate-binding protein n=1 Tax=Mucilaginibacter auburnensis TaxID=1457233 RepID=A0A2H9VS81_9SPHI|nr:molybdate ABC transporter substrate-binding protein [Mucilaginibacter auburnensis]PJJ83652.1 molybdate transport system substrate-binding protein [Mucilaginibacter auburnensis]